MQVKKANKLEEASAGARGGQQNEESMVSAQGAPELAKSERIDTEGEVRVWRVRIRAREETRENGILNWANS
jgi:hypothetical protein